MTSRKDLEDRLARLERGLIKVPLPGGGEAIISAEESVRAMARMMQASLGVSIDERELQHWADIQAKDGVLAVTSELAKKVLSEPSLGPEELEAIAKSCDGDFAPGSENPEDFMDGRDKNENER